MVPKTGSRRSDGPISRFRFCGENVGRLFVVRSHDHAKFVGAFHLSRSVSGESRASSISIRFFKITDPFNGRSFLMCSHDPFFGTNINRILKNGLCERALRDIDVSGIIHCRMIDRLNPLFATPCTYLTTSVVILAQ